MPGKTRSRAATVRLLPPCLCLAALLLAAGTPLPVTAQMKPPMTPDIEASNKQLIKGAFDAWAAGTGGPFALLADDAQWTIVGNSLASKAYPDKAAFMNEVIGPFNARLSRPLKPTIRKLVADGDTVIAFFDAEGLARDGKPYVNTYAWIMELRAGRIVRVWAFFDAIAFDDLWTRVKPAPSPGLR